MTSVAPTGLRPRTIFTCFRFALYIPARQEIVPLQSCFNDPFTQAVWLGRAHVMGEPTLANRLIGVSETAIYMWPLTQGFGSKVRCIKIGFETYRWLPLDLDGRRDEVAMEWVALELGSSPVGPVEDLNREDVPPPVLAWFSPPRAEET